MMKIQLTLDGKVIPATLADSDAARAIAAMLPLDLTLYDLFGREKFGALPDPMPAAAMRAQTYEVGEIICWSAGPDLAILHAQDGHTLLGKYHSLGRIDMGAEAFGASGPLAVRIELANDDSDTPHPRGSAQVDMSPAPQADVARLRIDR